MKTTGIDRQTARETVLLTQSTKQSAILAKKMSLVLSIALLGLGAVFAVSAGYGLFHMPSDFYVHPSEVGTAVRRYYVTCFLFGGALYCGGIALLRGRNAN